MNTAQAIRARRSIRKYKQGAIIPQEHIDLMLESAMCAPSAVNKRPWSFIVIENPDMRKQLADTHPYARYLRDASLGVIVCGDPAAFPEAPKQGFWPQDCAAATQTLMLQAVELGYGSCWCGIYPNEDLGSAIAELLDIRGSIPFSLIVVGVSDENPEAKGFYNKEKVRYIR